MANYARTRNTPFPTVEEMLEYPFKLSIYFPIVVVVLTLSTILPNRPGAIASRLSTPKSTRTARDPIAFIVLFGMLSAFLFLKGIVRANPIHMAPSLIPSLMLLAYLTELATQKAIRLGPHIFSISTIALACSLSAAQIVVMSSCTERPFCHFKCSF